ncbi:hypothetical protein [Rubripirellula reticaptiva]|uniref:Secreted protein n=1 Tax=Rubripirellula reticaptiva TaxID=2528013 RepID=A0A5C6EEK6_9BACT|nr:hypothetical protein [Rubripirellula reticaptiva]TWU46925.1 hypothetical protein Poly59_58990 [Rubripirellula reticaptiva]
MKTTSLSLVLLFSLMTMILSTGCGGNESATSVTEGIPVSDLEAYEARVKEMEAEAMKEMAGDGE